MCIFDIVLFHQIIPTYANGSWVKIVNNLIFKVFHDIFFHFRYIIQNLSNHICVINFHAKLMNSIPQYTQIYDLVFNVPS